METEKNLKQGKRAERKMRFSLRGKTQKNGDESAVAAQVVVH